MAGRSKNQRHHATLAGRRGSRADAENDPLFANYQPLETARDEMFDARGQALAGVAPVVRMLDELGRADFRALQRLADATMLRGGITFTVYGDKHGVERVFPFDSIPRVVSATDWAHVEAGLEQRLRALNLFLADVYGEQRILAEGVVPREVVESSRGYLPQVRGIVPPGGVHVHVAGIDLVRDRSGEFLVLEDNLRCPSGVSYVLENRAVMKRVLPRVFAMAEVRSVDSYPMRLLDSLRESAPSGVGDPHLVVLTPGPYNSAYFEHSVLARRMGCDLVIPSDLFVDDDRVFVRTTGGPVPIDIIYRRIDDEFLDPEVFREDSLLGVPGLMRAYRAGNVTLANALGNGVADDKGVYPFVPEMIRFYLGEQPRLGQVPTLRCDRDEERRRVIDDPAGFVIKAVDGSGGYGLTMGPKATRAELAAVTKAIEANPRGYIAQPVIELSTCPTWTARGIEPRRVDLRPYVLSGKGVWVLPGGLTRVALERGSYVVNSSQGGGSKDTWIVEGPA